MPLEPGSVKEDIFVHLSGGAWVLCLWILVARYKMVKGKSVNKRTKIMLIIITAAVMLSWIFTFIEFLESYVF